MKTLIIVDLEATCEKDDPYYNKEIIEIGAVKVVDGIIKDEFDIFVKPLRNPVLSDFCKELTHIKQSDIDSGINPKDAINRFYDWATNDYQEDVYYVSWGGFDKKQLLKEACKNKLNLICIEEIKYKHYNLKNIYAKVLKLHRQLGTLNALKKEGLVFDGSNHRGIDDSKNIYRIYMAQKSKINRYFDKEASHHENY